MASSGGNHLSPAGGREVVFCHACQNEWYRGENDTLTCPSCGSTFTEIVDSHNDPRPMHGILPPLNLSGRSSPLFRRPGGSDSDPDEFDIEDHVHNEPRFPFGRPNPERSASQNERDRASANEGDAILRRFADMIMNDLGAGRAARASPGLRGGGMFASEDHSPLPGTRFQRTTFRTGPFGASTSVTITSGTLGGGPEGPPLNFGTLFDQIFGNPWGTGADDARQRDRGAAGGPGFAFTGGLADLLNTLTNPAAAVHGDAVFTQEALDRIITQLMENSPQTNAAPPASQSAIESLEKKRVDDEMLGPEGKAECTICIDEIKKGDEVTVLPCKHWYHGECVVLWLKEHNTCPICRKPIESREGGGSGSNNSSSSSSGQQSPHSQQPQEPSTSASTSSASASGPSSSSASPFSFSSFTARPPRPERDRDRDRPLRTARENLERLNAIRNLAGVGSSESQNQGSSSTPHRRNSHSPPGLYQSSDTTAEGASSRERERERDRERDRERERGWERDRDRDRWSRIGWGEGGFSSSVFLALGNNNNNNNNGGGEGSGSGRRGSAREGTQQQQQQGQGQQGDNGNGNGNGGGGGGNGGGGALGWLREHFSRRS